MIAAHGRDIVVSPTLNISNTLLLWEEWQPVPCTRCNNAASKTSSHKQQLQRAALHTLNTTKMRSLAAFMTIAVTVDTDVSFAFINFMLSVSMPMGPRQPGS